MRQQHGRRRVSRWRVSRCGTWDEDLKQRLRIRAAENGRSMEREVREILWAALREDEASVDNPGTAMHELFKPFVGVDPFIPPREPMGDPPRFD